VQFVKTFSAAILTSSPQLALQSFNVFFLNKSLITNGAFADKRL